MERERDIVRQKQNRQFIKNLNEYRDFRISQEHLQQTIEEFGANSPQAQEAQKEMEVCRELSKLYFDGLTIKSMDIID